MSQEANTDGWPNPYTSDLNSSDLQIFEQAGGESSFIPVAVARADGAIGTDYSFFCNVSEVEGGEASFVPAIVSISDIPDVETKITNTQILKH